MDPETLLSCLLLGKQSVSQPRPACLQGLRAAFIPRSAAKVDTPPGHDERGMHSDPPPSSPLSLQRRRDGGPFMESNQDPRQQIPLFFILLFTSSPFALFPLLCVRVVCSGRIHSAVWPQPSRGPWQARLGPQIRAVLGCCEGHESTNITPLSKRTLGPTTQRLCYCGSHTAGSEQIENATHMAGLSQKSNPRPYGTAYSWNWEHVNSLLVFSILSLFFLFFFLSLSGIWFKAINKCCYERTF